MKIKKPDSYQMSCVFTLTMFCTIAAAPGGSKYMIAVAAASFVFWYLIALLGINLP